MNLSDLLQGQFGQQLIAGISRQEGASEQETSSVLSAAIPAIMGMLKKNASTEEGASGIVSALQQHDGSMLDNISNSVSSPETARDGNAILQHILGDKKGALENMISQHTGIDTSKISGIIARLAPVILGFISKKTSEQNLSGSTGLTDALGGILGNADNSVFSSLLDQDGDGQLGLGDALSAFSKKDSSPGKSGGILGSIFGK